MPRQMNVRAMAAKCIRAIPKNISRQPTAWVREMVALAETMECHPGADILEVRAVVLMLRTELTARGG